VGIQIRFNLWSVQAMDDR